LERESAWLPDEESAANLGTLRRLANTVRDEDEDDNPRGWRTWMRNTNNTGIVCILS
jgi:hypothetical protein